MSWIIPAPPPGPADSAPEPGGRRRSPRGFALSELLAVLASIAILRGLPLASVQKVRTGTGGGVPGGAGSHGSPWGADGVFVAKTRYKVTDIPDGTSNTAFASESTLGDGPKSAVGAAPAPLDVVYAYLSGAPLSDSACAAATQWNVQQLRGFMWAGGEIRCASYNHYYPPH